MFGLFKKKQAAFPVTDKIFLGTDAKCKAMVKLANTDENVIFIHWFDDTCSLSSSYFGGNAAAERIYMVRDAFHAPLSGKRIIFAEHHPLYEKEREAYLRLKMDQAEVWSALDEPLFKKTGGEKLITMMQKMGMDPEEIIQHSLITRSIRKAQDKFAKKIVVENHASSQEDWFRKNAE